jgi:hypothetical protein
MYLCVSINKVLTTFIPNGAGQVVFVKHAKIVLFFSAYHFNFQTKIFESFYLCTQTKILFKNLNFPTESNG